MVIQIVLDKNYNVKSIKVMRSYTRSLIMLLLYDVNKPVAQMLISIILCHSANMQICILRKHPSRPVIGLSQGIF